MAAVPRGSSLFLGQGAGSSPSSRASSNSILPTPTLTTAKPPTTSTLVDSATQLASSAPFQSMTVVALAILFLCWLFIRWYDRRATGRR
jgi:hypothetical protein